MGAIGADVFPLRPVIAVALALAVQDAPYIPGLRVLPGSPAPAYPAGIEATEATVRAEIRVGADGAITAITFSKLKEGPFVDAARAALSRWTFRPALKGGVPAESTYKTDLLFTPPRGLPIQLGVTPNLRRRVRVGESVLTVEPGRDRFTSLLSFVDVTVRGQMRIPDRARVRVGVRTAPTRRDSREGYWVSLGNTQEEELPAGLLSPDDKKVRGDTMNAGAAQAFTANAHEWQSFEIACAERTLRVALGGNVVSAYTGLEERGGPVSLIVEKGEAEFKNLIVFRRDRLREMLPLTVTDPDAFDTGDEGVKPPQLTHEQKPNYTEEAMNRQVQGVVMLEAIVETDGTTGRVRVLESLSPDLDEQAFIAIKHWRFKPAMKDGKPVRARVDIEMTFTLRDR